MRLRIRTTRAGQPAQAPATALAAGPGQSAGLPGQPGGVPGQPGVAPGQTGGGPAQPAGGPGQSAAFAAGPGPQPPVPPPDAAGQPADPAAGAVAGPASGGQPAAAGPPADASPPATAAAPAATPAPPHTVRRTRAGGVWVGLALSAIVLLLLLVFILENGQQADIGYFGAHGHLPLGVALLLAAVAGALLVVIPGTARIIQLRRTARRHRALDAQAASAQRDVPPA